jgi:cell division protein ZapA
MAEKIRVDVEILGQKYVIRTEAPPEYVRELAGHVEQRVTEIRGDGPAQDPVKLLALAALYITDELFRLKDEHALADKDTSARLGALSELLGSVVTPETEALPLSPTPLPRGEGSYQE